MEWLRMLPVAVERMASGVEQYVLPGLADGRTRALAAPAEATDSLMPARSIAPPAANEDTAPALRQIQIRCTTELHRTVTEAARRAGQSPSQLVRCALAMLPADRLARLPDPGGPTPRDALRIGRRIETPRLRLRLPAGLDAPTIRRVLGFVADTARGANAVLPERVVHSLHRDIEQHAAHRDRLSEGLGVLAGVPLEGGVSSRAEALHVMRFPPGAKPSREDVSGRFRALAGVLHPDAGLLNHHAFMAQLLDARRLLLAG